MESNNSDLDNKIISIEIEVVKREELDKILDELIDKDYIEEACSRSEKLANDLNKGLVITGKSLSKSYDAGLKKL